MDTNVSNLNASAGGPLPVKLRLAGVSKTYANGTQCVEALLPVSLDISEGEFVIFFGPSGCGKSTLLNIIAGFEDPTAGEVTLDGAIVEGPHHDRLMLFQEHGLFPWLNVMDNVAYGLKRQFRFRPKARREKARQLLQMVHLSKFEKSSIHELSGGMKQRVALARALAPDPKVLLVDEPFPALDALTRAKLYGDLQEIFSSTRKTVVLVTHDSREAACLGDRVLVFSGRPGRVKADIRIELARPRDINDAKVGEFAARIMGELEAPAMKVPEHRIKYYVIGFYLFILAVWQALFSAKIIPDYVFPSPIQVTIRLWELATDNYLWPSIKATFLRMGIGFSISALIGLFIGLIMGMSRVVNSCLKSLFLGLQTLPTAAWVPISLLLFGLSENGIYFVIIMSSAPAVAIATSDGILHIPPIYLRAARTLGTPLYAMPARVILPAAMPSIVTGLKLGWTLAWHGGVSAELIKSSIGLGYLLYMGRELNDPAQLIGIMILTILFGLLLDRFVFGLIQKRILLRWGLLQKS